MVFKTIRRKDTPRPAASADFTFGRVTITPEHESEAMRRMWRKVGLQLLLVSRPAPGPHNPEHFESFCRDDLFAGKKQLDVPDFLRQLESAGCNGESLGADLRTLLRCTVVRVSDPDNNF